MSQAERRFATFSCEIRWVGKALSADRMRPWRCFTLITARKRKTIRKIQCLVFGYAEADMSFSLPRLYPILDASFLPAQNRETFLVRIVSELADAGVTLLQYRNKQGSDDEILADAAVIRDAATVQLKLVMNDRPDLAVRAGFDGVHVGQEDVSAAEARSIVGATRIVGVSTHSPLQLKAAATQPVDYVAIGPVFATASKQNPDPVIGLDGVRAARALTEKPLVAIGGITLEDAGSVFDAGADSVAVISALFGPGKDVAKMAKDFLQIRPVKAASLPL